ncbi:macro domain-containing protein [Actinoplanes sp. NEAU-A12]|uniref:Macro domain-containing protein n=1 Tax=Actinoplanes sandaracinus TaxID=3045177 RepID=A0ABT6WKL7_9ACTN|nr:macro domain-containing protein [Actinoplanes sandaracinus]MDI6100267.1 macro domain-containing protein [Actinoplanes sandaracinus]
MTLGVSDSDPGSALRDFCGMLRDLRKTAGGPTVESLDADRSFPLRRAHIYATLAGKIAKPPGWRFVEAFVRKCVAHAAANGVELDISGDLKEWEREYKKLTQLWERFAREQHSVDSFADRHGKARAQVLTVQDTTCYVVRSGDGTVRRVGVITGDIRQVRCANVWVNSENTEMEMARVHEFSISAIVRYEGARHDGRGRVAEDVIADELAAKVLGHRPVEPGSVLVTDAGELRRRNGVRYVIHVAAVHGEPGSGFHPMREIGRCVTNALSAAEHVEMPGDEPITVLFPLLGTGGAGGDVFRTAAILIHAARNYLRAAPTTRIATVLFLAYSDRDLRACQNALRSAGLRSES